MWSQFTNVTDGQTTCDHNTALCTKVHRAVKTISEEQLTTVDVVIKLQIKSADWIYTVGHKKRATLLGIISPMFRGGFLHFLHQWKQEKLLYWGMTKFATLPQLCLYTTWENLKTHTSWHNSTFWNQPSVYFNAQRHQQQKRVQVNCF